MTEQAKPSAESAADPAHAAVFALLYEELRRIARRELRRGGPISSSATTLLHDAYFKIKQQSAAAFPDEASFLAYAARTMRTLVIDRARSRQAQKRGGAASITSLPSEIPEHLTEAADLERLGAAVDALGACDAALAQLVDLKFFCGYSLVEIAQMRGVSERTIQRDWDKARMFLKRTIEDEIVSAQ